MATHLTLETISDVLQQQQAIVDVVDKHIRSVKLSPTIPKFYADFVMQHLFMNIRDSYQDGIFLSQGLKNKTPYYLSGALSHALRSAQESLTDLAYIMADFKHRQGNEYLRYLKFLIDKESKILGRDFLTKDGYNKIFPPELGFPLNTGSQWSKTSPQDKMEQGLKLYKIEHPDFVDFRFGSHNIFSSIAHGNNNSTIDMLAQTPEENLRFLIAGFQVTIPHLDTTLKSALKCYIQLYLGRNKDYEEMVKSMFSKSDVSNRN